MKPLFLQLAFIFIINFMSLNAQQKTISITIDDVPNTALYQKDHFTSKLLNALDSLKIPFTIFINEGKIYKTDFQDKNKLLLEKWIKNNSAIIGNHTYNHFRYSDIGFEDFTQDIEKGEILTKEYALLNKKEVKYFRFPYNDLGKDSIQHSQIKKYLEQKGYTIAPFTIESSDWMFNAVYLYYFKNGEIDKAKTLGNLYVEKTIELIRFFNTMSNKIYNRPIKQIYLCHDNAINTDYLPEIIKKLENDHYEIISFEASLTDAVYQQTDHYFKKWGISWMYRWMITQNERVEWMKKEPDFKEIENIYNEIFGR